MDNAFSLAFEENGQIVMKVQAISRFTHGKVVRFSHGDLLKVAFGDTCTANNFLILFLTSFSLAEMPIKRQLPLLSGVVTSGRLLLMSKDIPLLIFTTMLYIKSF